MPRRPDPDPADDTIADQPPARPDQHVTEPTPRAAGDPGPREPAVGGTVDGRYAIRREIGRGAVGKVFEALHLFTDRTVAIKVLMGEHRSSTEARARLVREARALALARHPYVVEALDAGTDEDGAPYLAMELVEGRTLGGVMAARGRLAVADVVRMGQQLCAAIDGCHRRGVVHRDVKPRNVLVSWDASGREIVKLFDFGIALLRGQHAHAGPKLTRQGIAIGTPKYMAPEQILASPDIDHRTDIYSLGVMLYECLAGAAPFRGKPGELVMKTLSELPPPLAPLCPEAGPALVRAIEKALAKDADARFASAQEFAAALRDASAADAAARTPSSPLPAGPAGASGFLGFPPPEAVPAAGRAGGTARRRHPRAPYVTFVEITDPAGGVYRGRSEDVSESGLLVVADLPDVPADIVDVRFALPTGGRICDVRATARWVRSASGRVAVGLEFVALPAADCNDIRAYVERMSRLPGAGG